MAFSGPGKKGGMMLGALFGLAWAAVLGFYVGKVYGRRKTKKTIDRLNKQLIFWIKKARKAENEVFLSKPLKKVVSGKIIQESRMDCLMSDVFGPHWDDPNYYG